MNVPQMFGTGLEGKLPLLFANGKFHSIKVRINANFCLHVQDEQQMQPADRCHAQPERLLTEAWYVWLLK